MSKFDIYKDQFSKFKHLLFRSQQEMALEFIDKSSKPIIVIVGPCGIGKSLLGMTAGAMYDGCTYLVSSKQLQRQLVSDFTEATSIFGRNNYGCQQNKTLTCEDCVNSERTPCDHKGDGCLYDLAKHAALSSKYRILNYVYHMFESNFVGRFSTPNGLVVCDEADMLEKTLSNFVNLHVPAYVIKRTRMSMPSKKTAGAANAIDIWIKWAELLKNRLSTEIGVLSSKVRSEEQTIGGKPEVMIKTRNSLKSIQSQVDVFVNSVDKNWILEIKKDSWMKHSLPSVTFKPVWMDQELSEKYFWRHGSKFILMSATFPPANVLAKTLGRMPGDFDYLSLPSAFDVDRRKVYSLGVAKLVSKKDKDGVALIDKELPKSNDAIQYILKNGFYEHDTVNTKGIIHTVSWKLNKYVVENDKTGRIITHNSNNKDEVLEKFYKSDRPLVLASPSITRGVDLKYDLCRHIHWLKAPFLHLGDKLTNARAFGGGPVGNSWYTSMCAQEVVQGCGRGMRAKDDWCISIVYDKKIQELMVNNREYFAPYFLESVEIDMGGWKK